MKILVTGAAGFIGSHLVEALVEDGQKVVGIDNFDPFYRRDIKEKNLETALLSDSFRLKELDICQNAELLKHLEENKYDVVVHLAAKAGVRHSMKAPLDYVKVNVGGTVSLMDAMAQTGHKKLIFASSSSVYGRDPRTPFREDQKCDYGMSVYAATKQSGESFTRLYHNIYGFSVINLRFFTVYGPRQRPDLAIHKFLKAALLGEKITVFGDGSMARDYTYIDDIICGAIGSIRRIETLQKSVYETYNLGHNTPVTVGELVAIIEDVCDKKCHTVMNQVIPLGDVPITYADISKASEYLGHSPSLSIREGIKEMYSWICSTYSSSL